MQKALRKSDGQAVFRPFTETWQQLTPHAPTPSLRFGVHPSDSDEMPKHRWDDNRRIERKSIERWYWSVPLVPAVSAWRALRSTNTNVSPHHRPIVCSSAHCFVELLARSGATPRPRRERAHEES